MIPMIVHSLKMTPFFAQHLHQPHLTEKKAEQHTLIFIILQSSNYHHLLLALPSLISYISLHHSKRDVASVFIVLLLNWRFSSNLPNRYSFGSCLQQLQFLVQKTLSFRHGQLSYCQGGKMLYLWSHELYLALLVLVNRLLQG